ncbi:glycine zipper 2TM domain-containing protein [Ramlibacter sp.]|uniref:glycine zipper 2TM domain-containing protein n=1 Tax=Ramlibacter sp. TaxID=1917967 RepID=UPI002CBF9397|nr:glycine zipper 2TM domain-containing protein [Ramlibacter sp.]HWI82297.1 glycine zipper 2TM domain-containing protein [Ramlibacter sp.]
MKKHIALVLIAAAAGAHAETFVDSARVRNVEPQYERVTVPRNECNSQWVSEVRRTDDGPQYGGAIVGGVAGALLGNQVGRGHGREAATALGAVVGAFAGDRVANGNRPAPYEEVPREVTTCRTVNEVQSRIAGYRVGYEYRGQYYTTFMHEQPGPNLQVRVSVDPVVR